MDGVIMITNGKKDIGMASKGIESTMIAVYKLF